MSINYKSKSHGMRKDKHRTPHKDIKRGGSKRKYRKVSLKNRKRIKDANRNYHSHC